MTDKERLEEIKQRFKAMNELPSFKKLAPTELFFDDIDYLIQQAERVEELRKINKWLEDGWDTEIKIRQISDERIGKLFEKNQRYKQALEFYADEDNYEEDNYEEDKFNMFAETPVVKYDKGQKARQALEGDKP
ncbi:hypothetical protein NSA56_01560 [Oceanobacillus caeni]|uniref:hypothetical protein n=1 Tax=Oceanobacillus caeni TaxID=405946 RepID=UPI00214A0FFC|nr:hypothetical protein [Oceanobacillus caeni]MCR1833082.1 hypothetical protein [Oceanobacillus caeni]